MRRITALSFIAALLVGPVSAQADTPVACGDDRGREHLTLGESSFEIEAPAVLAPELAATYQETGPLVTRHRTAQFQFVMDTAPYSGAELTARIDWDTLSDYDLLVHDEFGDVRGSSQVANIEEGQTTFEELIAPVFHCEAITVSIRNWAGIPGQPIRLSLDVTGTGSMLACAANDPAPGCEGKAEGEAPVAAEDNRTRLFLAGDPGHAAMLDEYVWTVAQEDWPFDSAMTTQRPTGGVPNKFTRALFGFREPSHPTAHRNPLIAHFDHELTESIDIEGAPSAMVWVSSASIDATSVIHADLYADGSPIASTSVTGAELVNLRDPRAIYFTFPEVDYTAHFDLTLQIGVDPVATTDLDAGNPSDAHLTVWYGSAQFQSRLTLPA